MPLAFAAKYVSTHLEPSANNDVGGEVSLPPGKTKKHKPNILVSKKKIETHRDVQYPDHASPAIRKSIYVLIAVIFVALIGISYVALRSASNDKYQVYMDNLQDSITSYEKCLGLLAKKGEHTNTEVEREYRDARSHIGFLQSQRKHLEAPKGRRVEELLAREKRLDAALGQLERRLTSGPIQAPKSGSPAETVSPQLGHSTLGGPPPAPSDRPKPPSTPKVEENAVMVALPGVARSQVTEEFVQRFADLADQSPGEAKVHWAGDLLMVQITPVADPSKFALRIRSGKLLHYSSSDRILTVQLDERRNSMAEDPTRDPVSRILTNLKQRDDLKKVAAALTSLSSTKTLDRQAEVAVVLEALASDRNLEQNLRDSAIKLLPVWSGRDCVPILIKLMDDPSTVIKWSALDALGELKATKAADAIAKRWGSIEASRVTRTLIALGAGVETTVLPYLQNNDNSVIKVEVCKVLQEVGTDTSLKPLLDVINDKNQSSLVNSAAKEAMKSILERQ